MCNQGNSVNMRPHPDSAEGGKGGVIEAPQLIAVWFSLMGAGVGQSAEPSGMMNQQVGVALLVGALRWC